MLRSPTAEHKPRQAFRVSGRLPHTRRASCKRVRHEGRTPALAISRTSPLARGVSRFSSLRMSSRLGPATSMRKAQIGSWIDQKEQQDQVPSSCPLLRASVARPRRGHGMLSLSTEQHAIEGAIAFEWRLSMDFARLRGPVQLESSQRVGRGRCRIHYSGESGVGHVARAAKYAHPGILGRRRLLPGHGEERLAHEYDIRRRARYRNDA